MVLYSGSGNFRLEFKEPWYWRVCERISLLTAAGAMVIYFKRKCSLDRNRETGENL